ncbi:hypothetical protein [Aeromonas salmonicida]|uniref:Uncharacterized protein n=1 Tax=Aeromonas salmonicida TaxID=645 RepID=A0AAX3VVE9_AERSA|nr:hypothetical protein [Aeromonas salmonicida]MDM5067649.1 hypothetical protein [Aeromonas salmonicida]MDM5100445.1 hypothetical protein [Aeromonas salmonicida]MDQ1883299.1 hypothetical protein [Aeromonas salmonicida]WHF37957.1 hypothetical protein QLQ87_06295 [Aeromonas salmonicida]VFB11112.1 Uncharacterised protein [Aeromonas salmonicida]
MQNFDVVNRLMQQTASLAMPAPATVQLDGAISLWQVTHAG